jgi:hypothetical protein
MADDLKMYLDRELSCMRYYEAIGAFDRAAVHRNNMHRIRLAMQPR